MTDMWLLEDEDLRESQGRGAGNRIMGRVQGDWTGSDDELSGKDVLMVALESLLGRLSGR